MKTLAQAGQGNFTVDPGKFTGMTGMELKDALFAVIEAALIIITITALVIIIIGGVRYIISQGNDQDSEKAKKTILYAAIGLIVVALSLALVNFVERALA